MIKQFKRLLKIDKMVWIIILPIFLSALIPVKILENKYTISVSYGLTSLFILAGFLFLFRKKMWSNKRLMLIDWAFIFFVGWHFLSIFWSTNHLFALQSSFGWLLALLYFFILRFYGNLPFTAIRNSILITLAINLIFLIFLLYNSYISNLNLADFDIQRDVFQAYFVNDNDLSTFFISAIPFLFLGIKNVKEKVWMYIFSSLLISCIIIIGSRGALLSLLIIIPIYLLRIRSKINLKEIIVPVLAIGIIVTAAFLYGLKIFVFNDSSDILHRFSLTREYADYNQNDRITLLKNSFSLMSENPFHGVGSGNWPIEIKKYGIVQYTQTSWDEAEFFDSAYNIISQVGTEIGIVGLILFFLVFYIPFIKQWFSGNNLEKSPLFLIMLSGTFYLVYSLFYSHTTHGDTMSPHLILFLIALHYLTQTREKSKKINNSTKTLFVSLLTLSAICLIYYTTSGIHQRSVLTIIKPNTLVKSDQVLEDLSPSLFSVHPQTLQKGMVHLARKKVSKGEDVRTILKNYLEKNPYAIQERFLYAASIAQGRNYSEAIVQLQKVLDIHPDYFRASILRAELFHKIEEVNKIPEALSFMFQIKPVLDGWDLFSEINPEAQSVWYEGRRFTLQNIINFQQYRTRGLRINPNIYFTPDE